MASDKLGFFAELKRRNVLRAAVLYAGAVWALSQGISQLSPALGLPDYATRWFLIAAMIGFPFWLAFAWFYQFTPQGIKRESEVASSGSITHSTARKLDFAIIGVLMVAVALLASGYFIKRGTPAYAGVTSAKFDPPADTLVVLPFTNLDKNPQQQYFSDGITEELTNALGQNTALRVIAWNTASKYRDSKQSAADIAKTLDVANVLTGKILRQGNEIRVIVELVNARTGYQAWSHHYDDSLSNIFQVQDKITASISDALKVKFAVANTQRTVNPQAYDLVQQARALMEKGRTTAPFEQARSLLEQAIALDPGYAEAHAQLARVWFGLTQVSTLSLTEALSKAHAEATKALALDPGNVYALLELANIDATDGRVDKANAGYERVLQIDPSNASAHLDYALMLPGMASLAESLEAVRLDPESANAQNNLSIAYLDLGEYQNALAPAQASMRITQNSADSAFVLAAIYSLLHRDQDAVKVFDLAKPETTLAKQLIAAGRMAYQSVLDPKLRPQVLAAADTLRRRSDLDPNSVAELIQIYGRLGEYPPMLELLPGLCTVTPAGCSDLSVNPTYLPLHGDQRFEALVKKYDTTSKPPAAAAPASASSR